MSDLLATLTILVLFFIRFGIPFLTLALISYVLHRLNGRWQEETQHQQML
jgi:hypothetical protein